MADVPKDITAAAQGAVDRMPELKAMIDPGEFWELVQREVEAALLAERERRTAQGVTVPDGWKLYAWASSKPYRLNHLMSAAQYSNALPKNRVDFDIPLYGPAAPSLSTSAGGE